MNNKDFTTSFTVNQSAQKVFNAINNVRGWWSEEIEGDTYKLNDEFNYHYQDLHRCKIKIVESVPGKRIVWLVLDNYFSFTQDKKEWTGTKIIFDIIDKGDKVEVVFTHEGLVPEYECYNACVNGWTQYINNSLPDLVNTGNGQPNTSSKAYTIHEVAARFNELAQKEKWFEIQDEFFSDDVKSIEPDHSPWFKNAAGKTIVRKKGEDFIKNIEAVHRSYTSEPLVAGNHFAVGRELDMTVKGFGRIQHNQVMVYEVKDGKIILEQFFY